METFVAILLNSSKPERSASASSQVVFIDPTVTDYEALLAGIAPGTEVYLLDRQEAGLAQIAQVLQD